ncbi:DNA-directed RNA polymerase [Savitreella phatthalungensis]
MRSALKHTAPAVRAAARSKPASSALHISRATQTVSTPSTQRSAIVRTLHAAVQTTPEDEVYATFTRHADPASLPLASDGQVRPAREPLILPRPEFRPPTKRKMPSARIRTADDALALYNACIETNNLSRAEVMLDQVRHLCDDSTTRVCANRYLGALIRKLSSVEEMERAVTFIKSWQKNWSILGDRLTYALLCKGALKLENVSDQQSYVRDFARQWQLEKADFGEVLAVSDVLSVDEVRTIFQLAGLDYRQLGPQFRKLIAIHDKAHPLADVPELLPVRQSGRGLQHVKFSLQALVDPNAYIEVKAQDYAAAKTSEDGSIDDDLAFQFARQRMLEENAVDAAMQRWREEHEDMKKRGQLNYKRSLNAMFWQWKEDMLPLIKEELARVDHRATDNNIKNPRDKRSGHGPANTFHRDERVADYEELKAGLETEAAQRTRREYGPLLFLLKPEKMAAITILEVLRCYMTLGGELAKTAAVVTKIGQALELEYQAHILKGKNVQDVIGMDYKTLVQSEKLFNMTVRRMQAEQIDRRDSGLFKASWSPAMRARVGALMLSFLIHAARIELETVSEVTGERLVQDVSAFIHTYQYNRGQRLGVLKINEQLIGQLSSEPLKGNVFPRYLPMLVQPKPWFSWNSGGYFYTPTRALRAKQSNEQRDYVAQASREGRLDTVLAGLDVLGATSWRINRKVFDCAVEAWNSGQGFAKIPPAELELNVPPMPPSNAEPKERFMYNERLKELTQTVRNAASVRSDYNYKLEIARAFLHDKIYFPHSLDFRGRAYPIPPHFNHLGNDLCRGLLRFAESRPLGASGLRWLKIHFANQCGYDKASFEERVTYADEHAEQVFEAADHPMDGSQWWREVENPWQCLASCMELAAALRHPDPAMFESSLPVHQDGTCNGLQHYAALGGDIIGAKQVNLEPSDRPQDVYKGVAEIVSREVDEEAASGNDKALRLRGRISRKVVKQTVMTNVYGVTYIGARAQIENQLRNLDSFCDDEMFALTTYLTTKTFKALQSMFGGAHEIQNWLREASLLITKSVTREALAEGAGEHMTAVIWTTPLDLPVVQPYRKEVRKQIMTNLQTVYLADPSDAQLVDSRKQAGGFPPNYIHSLDATHMLMSALACRDQGIAFAAVHDSYWTHAADTDTMNAVLRDAFIKLHSADLMTKLRDEFVFRYRDHLHPYAAKVHKLGTYRYALQAEHFRLGKVQVVPGTRAIVVKDEILANEIRDHKRLTIKRAGGRAKLLAMNVAAGKKGSRHEIEEGEDEEPIEDDGPDIPSESSHFTPEELEAHKHFLNCNMLWLPIKFPPIPNKGDFDVNRLRESKYFFS